MQIMKTLKQVEIANKANISTPFLSQIIGGSRRPSWTMAKKLAEATGTDPVLWMEGNPDQLREAIKKAA